MPMPSKVSLRENKRQLRQKFPQAQQELCAAQICQHLINLPIFKCSRHIACYFAISGEVKTDGLIKAILEAKKHCYLPVLNPSQGNSLVFMPYQTHDSLQINRYGIAEPILVAQKILPATELDVVFLPLLVFDNQGHRVGMGAGYYDRTFAFLQQNSRPSKPLLIGLAYEWQRTASITTEPWDITLDGVCTEIGMDFF